MSRNSSQCLLCRKLGFANQHINFRICLRKSVEQLAPLTHKLTGSIITTEKVEFCCFEIASIGLYNPNVNTVSEYLTACKCEIFLSLVINSRLHQLITIQEILIERANATIFIESFNGTNLSSLIISYNFYP